MADDTEDDSGSGQAPAPASSVASLVYNGLIQRGVNPNVAYGALGSLMGESGRSLNTGSINRGDGSDGSDSLGFGQWNGARAQNLQSTAQSMGLNWNDPNAQVAHLFNELDGKYKSGNYSSVLNALKQGKTVADGNDTWTRNYEVPANVDAQVALRLAHGNALAQGAQQGTLDLNKVGSFSGPDGPQNGNAFQANAGALSANNLAGGDLGALYKLAQQQQPDDSFGTKLTRAAASMASIWSPSQGQTLMALANQGQQNKQSPADTLIKALALKKAIQTSQAPDPVKMLGDANGKGQNVYDPTSGQMKFVPYAAGGVTEDDVKTPQKGVQTLYGQDLNNATLSAGIADKAGQLRQRLRDNPELANELNGSAPLSAFINNFAGQSNDMSQLQKEIAAVVNQHMMSVGQSVKGAATGKVLDMERNSVAPLGATNDPVTLDQALARIQQRQREIYSGNASTISSINQQYPGQFKFQDPVTQKPVSWDDYNKSKSDTWDSMDKSIDSGTAAFLARHKQKVDGKTPTNFYDAFKAGF